MDWQFQIFYISKILWGVGFSSSAPKRWFIFYNSFSLRLTENLHEQKHFLKTWYTCFVYIIFLNKIYNKKNIYHRTIPLIRTSQSWTLNWHFGIQVDFISGSLTVTNSVTGLLKMSPAWGQKHACIDHQIRINLCFEEWTYWQKYSGHHKKKVMSA